MIVIGKESALVEDIEFGMGVSAQTRGGNQLNASHLPYNAVKSVTNELDLKAYSTDIADTYALMNGDSTEIFRVANGVNPEDAMNMGQASDLADLKADIADVLIRGSTNDSYVPQFDYDPATKRYADNSIADKFVGAITVQFIAYSISDGTTPVTVTVTNGIITGVV